MDEVKDRDDFKPEDKITEHEDVLSMLSELKVVANEAVDMFLEELASIDE